MTLKNIFHCDTSSLALVLYTLPSTGHSAETLEVAVEAEVLGKLARPSD